VPGRRVGIWHRPLSYVVPRPPTVHSRVYLTGFMGSGKTTVGPLVARALGWRFVDLDARVEARAGRTITELIAEGEEVFREVESEALVATTRESRVVVATGGGTISSASSHAVSNRLLARPAVWLRVPPARLGERLEGAFGRPLLHGAHGPLDGDALVERIESLLGSRTDAYATADAVVDADAAPAIVAHRVVEAVRTLGIG